MLVPGDGKRLAGELVSKGYGVAASAKDGALEFSGTGSTLGCIVAMTLQANIKPAGEETLSQQMNTIIGTVLDELGILYHSVVTATFGDGASMSWRGSNIKTSDTYDRKPLCKKGKAMKRYGDMTADEKRQIDDILVIEVLNRIGQSDDEKRLPTDDMQRQYDEFEADIGGALCGCGLCITGLRDKLKRHHDLTEYVLSRANSMKPNVVVPEQNDLIIKFDPTL